MAFCYVHKYGNVPSFFPPSLYSGEDIMMNFKCYKHFTSGWVREVYREEKRLVTAKVTLDGFYIVKCLLFR